MKINIIITIFIYCVIAFVNLQTILINTSKILTFLSFLIFILSLFIIKINIDKLK